VPESSWPGAWRRCVVGSRLDLNTLETLLETMDTESIRGQYAQELVGNHACIAMLDEFDALDSNFQHLKYSSPAPQTPSIKNRKKRVWLSWALPIAALVVLAIVLRSPEMEPMMPESEAPADIETKVLKEKVEMKDSKVESPAVSFKEFGTPEKEPKRKAETPTSPRMEPNESPDLVGHIASPKEAEEVPAPLISPMGEEKQRAMEMEAGEEPKKGRVQPAATMIEDSHPLDDAISLSVAKKELRQERDTRFRQKAVAGTPQKNGVTQSSWSKRFFGAWQSGQAKELADLFEGGARLSWPLIPPCEDPSSVSCFQSLITRVHLLEFEIFPISSTEISFSLMLQTENDDRPYVHTGILEIRLTIDGKCLALDFKPTS